MIADKLRMPGEIVEVPPEIGKSLQKRSLAVDVNELKYQEWMPNWEGLTCVIIGSGPSASDAPLLYSGMDNCKYIAINNSWRLTDMFFGFHADILFGIDHNWWELNKGVMAFPGLKICTSQVIIGNSYEIRFIPIRENLHNFRTDGNCLAYGGNSGFSAIHLSILLGCKKIVLVGFDMNINKGVHWHGSHEHRHLKNPDKACVERWAVTLDAQKPIADRLGVTIIDTCLDGGLTAYPKMALKEIFQND